MLTKNYRFIAVHFVLLCSICNSSFANEGDSLRRILSGNIADTVRINILLALSKTYSHSNPDSMIVIAASAKKLAEKTNYKSGLALALKNEAA